ncbi:MAG: outer membrane beta-barrel protein [Devosia sp.]
MRCFSALPLCAGLLLAAAGSAMGQELRGAVDDQPPIDWSVALGAQVVHDSGGTHIEATLAPEVSFGGGGRVSSAKVGLGGKLALETDGTAFVDDIHANGETSLRPDAFTSLTGSLDLAVTQLRPGDSSLPVNTAIGPLEFTGDAKGTAKRNFGRFDLTATVEAKRFIEGPTTLDDLSTVDNSENSYWLGGASLRAGFEVTPALSVFAEGGAEYQAFDAPSTSLAVFLDSRTATLRGGVSMQMDSVLTGEASVGYGWIDYADGSLVDRPAWIADASLTFTPDPSLEIEGALNTTLGPSDTVAGDTDVDLTASLSSTYQVNPWLDLRGSANGSRTLTEGTGDVGYGYGFGAGVDLRTSRHAVWSGDYSYGHSFAPPGPATDTHTVSVGLKITN